MRKILFLISVLLATSSFGCHRETDKEYFSSHLDQAVDGSIYSAEGALGDFEFRPFLASDNIQFGPQKSVRVNLEQGLKVSFLAQHAKDSELLIQAFSRRNPTGNLVVSLNGSPLGEISLDPDKRVHKLEVKSEQMTEGLNKLLFESQDTVFLKKAFVSEKLKPVKPKEAGARKNNLLLPYEAPLEFPWGADEKNPVLRVDSIQEWNDKGAPNSLIPGESIKSPPSSK